MASVPVATFPTRAEIRAIAERIHAEVMRARDDGRNPHQVALDLRDHTEAFARTLGPEQADIFGHMLAEELDAVRALDVDVAVERGQTERKWGAVMWGVAITLLVALPTMLRMCA